MHNIYIYDNKNIYDNTYAKYIYIYNQIYIKLEH